ncbi:hypothetical protein Pd630_LPD11019 (plasmid) [Rhodococcus opacus PD630]|nr:hypothetical protein Pd630_LPD11019 [Rhodococcus opacus PD630]
MLGVTNLSGSDSGPLLRRSAVRFWCHGSDSVFVARVT